MDLGLKKLHIIEELLRTDDQTLLSEITAIFNRTKKKKEIKVLSAYAFLGSWSNKDTQLIGQAIQDGCEKIEYNEW